MTLRVIWQYMDRSVTPKILYGPQKLRSLYCHMTFSAMNYFLYILMSDLKAHQSLCYKCLILLFRRAIEISLCITNFHNKGIMSLILFIFKCPDIFYWEINTNFRVFKSKVHPFSFIFMKTHLEHKFLSVRLYTLRFI